MNGEVIYFDSERGVGFATGADGNRYVFDRDDLGALRALAKGAHIEFRADGDRAREIALRGGVYQPAAAAETNAPWGAATADAPEAALSAGADQAQGGGATGLFGYFRRAVTSSYANFRGRARRKEYWGFFLFCMISFAIVGAAAFAAGTALGSNEAEEPVFTTVALGLLSLAFFVPSLAILVRRQHDIGLSGWFVLLALIPWIGAMIVFVFTLIPSQKHDNRWGPVPDGVRIA